jgi:epoxyqueuosine reductase QueG
LSEIVELGDEDYRAAVAGSAVKRARPDMMRRNAAIALANHGHEGAPAEDSAREHDGEHPDRSD